MSLKVIMGLGNPGSRFTFTRHNIGFRVLDALAEKHGSTWSTQGNKEIAQIMINDQKLLLVKPLTFMNSSGEVLPSLTKKGISADEMVVVHDELEKQFGKVWWKTGGSPKGHNGLRSIIERIGKNFHRVQVGIGRPLSKAAVPDYVLDKFPPDEESNIPHILEEAVTVLENKITGE